MCVNVVVIGWWGLKGTKERKSLMKFLSPATWLCLRLVFWKYCLLRYFSVQSFVLKPFLKARLSFPRKHEVANNRSINALQPQRATRSNEELFSNSSWGSFEHVLFQSRATTLSISEMKEFVQKNLKDIQTQSKAISMHIGAAEIIQVGVQTLKQKSHLL